jgi:hypothetical protein
MRKRNVQHDWKLLVVIILAANTCKEKCGAKAMECGRHLFVVLAPHPSGRFQS